MLCLMVLSTHTHPHHPHAQPHAPTQAAPKLDENGVPSELRGGASRGWGCAGPLSQGCTMMQGLLQEHNIWFACLRPLACSPPGAAARPAGSCTRLGGRACLPGG